MRRRGLQCQRPVSASKPESIVSEWTGVKGTFADTKLHHATLWRVQTQDLQIRDPFLHRLNYERRRKQALGNYSWTSILLGITWFSNCILIKKICRAQAKTGKSRRNVMQLKCTSVYLIRTFQMSFVRYINILTQLRGFQDKHLYLVLFSLYPELFWELKNKRNLRFCSKSFGAMLECLYIEHCFLETIYRCTVSCSLYRNYE